MTIPTIPTPMWLRRNAEVLSAYDNSVTGSVQCLKGEKVGSCGPGALGLKMAIEIVDFPIKNGDFP